MFRIVFVGVLIAAAMIVTKQDQVLQRAGLLGSCAVVAPPSGQDGDWHACKEGKLSGAPDLSLNSCTSAGYVGTVQYWRCPAAVGSNVIRQ
jgi:hypothetical protein